MASKARKGQAEHIRTNLWAVLQAVYDGDDYTELYAAASKSGIEKERARQAYKYGKGTEVILALILARFGIKPNDIKKQIPKLRKMFSKPGKLSIGEELIEEARNRLSENEFISELRTIIARDEIRTDLGLKKRPGRPPKKK